MPKRNVIYLHSNFSAREIVFTALMTALVFIATFVPHIPIPLGYAHLGDAVIFLAALLARRRSALMSACLGSALADLLGGFALWVMPTLIIKYGMVEVVCRLVPQGEAARRGRIVTALLLSSLWMALAYTLAGAVLYDGLTAALASTPGLLAEGVVNSIVALLLLPALRGRFPRM